RDRASKGTLFRTNPDARDRRLRLDEQSPPIPGWTASIPARTVLPVTHPMVRWRIAFLVSIAIAISYLDRQTLPWAIKAIQADIPISNEAKAFLDSSFLVTYGAMYLAGGRLLDFLGTRRGFLAVMIFWSVACMCHGLAGGILMLAACRLLLGG